MRISSVFLLVGKCSFVIVRKIGRGRKLKENKIIQDDFI